MCIQETRIYISKSGTEQRYDRVCFCSNSVGGQMCGNVERSNYRSRLEIIEPDTVPSTGDLVTVIDRKGREKVYRKVGRRGGKLSSSDIDMPRSPRLPRAPTPPPPAGRHWHPWSSEMCSDSKCITMSGANPRPIDYGIEARSPSYNKGERVVPNDPLASPTPSKKSVKIKTPSEFARETPRISPAPVPRNKAKMPVHKRVDSGQSYAEDPVAGPSRPRPAPRIRREDEYIYEEARNIRSEQERVDAAVARMIQAEDDEQQARLAAIERGRFRSRDDRRKDQAAADARRKARETQQSVQEDQIRAKRYHRARRDKAREVYQDSRPEPAPIRSPRLPQDDYFNIPPQEDFPLFPTAPESLPLRPREPPAIIQPRAGQIAPRRADVRYDIDPLAGPSSPTIARRQSARIVVIHPPEGSVARQPDPRGMQPSSEDILERERRRMDEADQTTAMRSPTEDPLEEDPFSTARGRVRDYTLTETDERRARMRRYREDRDNARR